MNISLYQAKEYLLRCATGNVPKTYYHKLKCKLILDAFKQWLSTTERNSAYEIIKPIKGK